MGGDAFRRVQMVGGFAVGAVALASFLWSLDWAGLAGALSRVSWRWMGVATVVMLAGYAAQGLRWRLLLKDVTPTLSWSTTWRATTVMWAGNTLLPLRAGLVLRPLVVLREHDVAFATVLSTVVAETVCDLIGVVGLLLLTVSVLPADLAADGPLGRMRDLGSWAGAVALILLAAVVLLSSPSARGLVDAAARRLPHEGVRGALLRGFDQVVAGLGVVRDPVRFLAALGWTAAVWLGWLLGILATLRAFGVEVGVAGALFLETALTLSMLVPQAPGFLGLFQVVTEESLGLFGAPESEAQGVALLFWTVCFVPVTVLGAVDAWRSGLLTVGRAEG